LPCNKNNIKSGGNIVTLLESLLAFINSVPNAAGQGLAWGIMAIGVYITYRILDVADLTVDGSLATGGAVAAVAISLGVNPWVALLLAIIAGMLAGFVTGFLHTACGIPAILAGILTQLALYSLNLRILGIGTSSTTKATVALNVNFHELLLTSRNVRQVSLENPLILLAILVAAIIGILYWFFGTEMGCSLRATGANVAMARAQGINTNMRKVIGLMISNGLVALSGALIAQYQGSATIDMGRGAIVIGLAAVIIGEVLFSKAFRNFALKLLAAVIGAIIYYLVITLVLRLGLESTDLKLLTALVVALFLAVPYLKGKLGGHSKKKGAAKHA
jgi:putative ABC transport system permease protein